MKKNAFENVYQKKLIYDKFTYLAWPSMLASFGT